MDAFILVFTLGIMLAIGVPVAYAVGISAIIGAWYIDIPLEAVMIQLTSGVNKFSLLAIPFFILAGAIMAEGGIARRLVNFAYIFVGFIRGGLSLVNIVASTFFGAISGSSVADTASIGSVMIPEMDKKGYPRDFAAAVRCRRFLRRPAITRLFTRWRPAARCRLPRCSSPGSCRGCC